MISVIIPVYSDWPRLARCLEALQLQTLPQDAFEIVVVDNEPEHNPPPIPLPPNARLVHEPRPGSYAARNRALSEARGSFLAFTDSDCVPDRDWLQAALRILSHAPSARVTGPVRIFREAGSDYFAYLYEFHTAFRQSRAVEKGRCATANLVVARNVFDAVGPFDENLVSGGDSEWGERAHRLGVPIRYEEAVAVSHPARANIASIIKKRRRIAGSEAMRMGYPTFWYVLAKSLPPFTKYNSIVFSSRRGSVTWSEWVVLFFLHWATRIAEAHEFLLVRGGLKKPNRS